MAVKKIGAATASTKTTKEKKVRAPRVRGKAFAVYANGGYIAKMQGLKDKHPDDFGVYICKQLFG